MLETAVFTPPADLLPDHTKGVNPKAPPRHLYRFRDGEEIYFARGNFDDWCVYRRAPGERARPPRDADYFAELLRLGERYGRGRVYAYFRAVYDLTDNTRRWSVFKLVGEQGSSLGEADGLPYAKVMVTLYYAMVAEENREPARRYPLKKKVKKIGVFQVLIEGLSPSEAASFSRGTPARVLLELLREYERRERHFQNGNTSGA